MHQNIWILNHYAGVMFTRKGGRHYWISKFLKQSNYEPVVFCSKGTDKTDHTGNRLYSVKVAEEIGTPVVLVTTRLNREGSVSRIIKMFQFYRRVQAAGKLYAQENGAPDVIYASSVHPLTLVAGIKLAKRFSVKCISEVRDLWPESLVAYGHLKRRSILAKILYAFEKRIYQKSDRVIMTWPGGYDYIRDRGWEKDIPEDKVIHISNGVDLEEYRCNMSASPYSDEELEDSSTKKIIYTGAIREVNNLGIIVKAAQILQDRGVDGFKLLIYGTGYERDALIRRTEALGLKNIRFMGSVPKNSVPSVLSKAYVTLLHNSSTELDRYGQSQNKFFEYLAAGKPILMTYSVGHSICRENNCGIEVERQSPEAIADAIEKFVSLDEDTYAAYCRNAEKTAEQFDFARLTQKLIQVIEST